MTRRRQPEKAAQAQVVALLRSVGSRVWVTGTRRPAGDHPGTCMTPGLPDVFAFVPRARHGVGTVLLCVEVKAAGGRLRLEQAAFQALCHEAQVAHVVGGVDEVIRWLLDRRVVRAEGVAHYRLAPTGYHLAQNNDHG